jgi:hypothetical protein
METEGIGYEKDLVFFLSLFKNHVSSKLSIMPMEVQISCLWWLLGKKERARGIRIVQYLLGQF